MTNKEAHYLTRTKIKGRWKQYTKNLYRRQKSMMDIFEEYSYEEESILESEVNAAL